MITRKMWWTTRKGIDGRGYPRRTIRVCREGWFLFGLIPLYIYDRSIEG